MVKIRYSDLPAGLHVTVETDGRSTIIYLLPGLTPAQRRAALTRVRSSGRMGQGPSLPAVGMARAVAADRVTTTVSNGAAAMRRHPMLLLPPLIVLVSAALVFALTSFVTLSLPHPTKAAPIPSQGPTVFGPGKQARSRPHGTDPPATRTPQPLTPAPSVTALPAAPGRSAQPASPSPSAYKSPPPGASPSPSSPLPPVPTPTPSPTSTCINFGLLGVCLTG